jgi:hypothetical protein
MNLDLDTLALAAVGRGMPEGTTPQQAAAMQVAIVKTFDESWRPRPASDDGRPRTPFYVLVRSAVRNAGRMSTHRKERWSHVVDALAVGSTFARELCVAAELDPDELVGTWSR